jgi:UMF1 family MFS transporter
LKETVNKRWFTRTVFYWTLFDFANSSFATIVYSLVFAVYFKSVVAMNLPIADFYWSTSINISMIIVAVLSPVLGAAADYYASKKKYLGFFTALCIIATGLLYFVGSGMIVQGMILFILANIGFQAGLGFYDTFLKEITVPEFYNKVSSAGYAIGYLGSLLSLAVIIPLENTPRLTFVACSVIFLLFSLPIFLFVKEKSRAQFSNNKKHWYDLVKIGLQRTSDTIKHIRQYSNLRKFLLSYFLYIDGVNTIIVFSAIYAQTTLKFTMPELVIFFVIVQVTAVIGSYLFGWLADKFGTKRILSLTILGWVVLTIAVFFSSGKTSFMVIGAFAGFFLGSSQALSRSFMSTLIPDFKKTEFFGFYSLFEKTSTILGPLTFGLVSWLTADQRIAVLSIAVFFVLGYLLLNKVQENEMTKKETAA